MTSNHYDMIISGAGMVGGTLACALGGSALNVAVIEPQPPAASDDGYDLRASAITPASQTVFENLGAWEGMRKRRVSPVETMRVWEQAGEVNYDSADIGEPCLAWIIENRVIVAALAERLPAFANIEVMSPARVEEIGIGDERVTVRLDNGRSLPRGCWSGRWRRVARRRAAGIGWTRHDLAQSAIVAMVQTERPHAHTAHQQFLATGPLAFLPLAEPNTVSIVWSADSARARALMALDDAAFNTELQAAFGTGSGPCGWPARAPRSPGARVC
jgi:2-octaprenylphenol hydroxylase